MRHKPQNLYFSASISMKVKNSIFWAYIFLFNENSTDILALIVCDIEVCPLEEPPLVSLLFAKDRIDVIGVFTGCNNSFPGSFEVLFK